MLISFIPIISLVTSIFLLNYNLNRLIKYNSKISILFFLIEIFCVFCVANILTRISNEHDKLKKVISRKSEVFVSYFWFFIFLFMTLYFLYKNSLIFNINIYTFSCIILVVLSFILNRVNLNIYYLLSILFLIGFIPEEISNIDVIFFKKHIRLIDLLYSSCLLTSTFSMLLRILTIHLFRSRL